MRLLRVDDRIELHAVSPEMTGELFRLVSGNFSRLHEWMQWAVDGYTIEHARAFTEISEKQWTAGQSMNYAIICNGKIAGGAGLNVLDRINRATEIGYWLSGEHVGKGVVTRCVRRLLELSFRDLEMHRVVIKCASGNVRSRAIPERLGFTEEGTMRECEWLHGRYADLVVYSMLIHEWPSSIKDQ